MEYYIVRADRAGILNGRSGQNRFGDMLPARKEEH